MRAAALLFCVFLSSCRASAPPLVGSAPEGVLPVYVAPIDVAVLPFQNVTDAPGAGERGSSAVSSAIAAEGIADFASDGEVRAAIVRRGIRWTNRIEIEEARKLGQDLGVDYLLTGAVTSWSEGTNPSVGIHVRILELATGEIVFSATQDLSAIDRVGAFESHRLVTADAVLNAAAHEIAQALVLEAPIPGWRGLDPLERRRRVARSRATLERIESRIRRRIRTELEGEWAPVREDLARARADADSFSRAGEILRAAGQEERAALSMSLATARAEAETFARAAAAARVAAEEERASAEEARSALRADIAAARAEADSQARAAAAAWSAADEARTALRVGLSISGADADSCAARLADFEARARAAEAEVVALRAEVARLGDFLNSLPRVESPAP